MSRELTLCVRGLQKHWGKNTKRQVQRISKLQMHTNLSKLVEPLLLLLLEPVHFLNRDFRYKQKQMNMYLVVWLIHVIVAFIASCCKASVHK